MNERRFVVVDKGGDAVSDAIISLEAAEKVLANVSITPTFGPYRILECVDPAELERLRKDAERLAHVVKYNWIGAKTRCEHKIEDGNLESTRAAIDTAIRAEKGERS